VDGDVPANDASACTQRIEALLDKISSLRRMQMGVLNAFAYGKAQDGGNGNGHARNGTAKHARGHRRRRESRAAHGPLETYLREISETPLLTADQEKELSAKVLEGDSEARDLFVRANLRLVVSIARGYTSKGVSLDDLIQEGNLGLLRAVEGYDPQYRTRFGTYASYWIKQSIKRALMKQSRVIRIPEYMHNLLSKWGKARNILRNELDRDPTTEEVRLRLGLPKKAMRTINKALLVHDPQRETDDFSLDLMTAGMGSEPPSVLMEAEDIQKLYEILGMIDLREATILNMRYGLDGDEPKTLKEIGELLRITRERVRQIEAEAVVHLQELMIND
jgi:RNA polymerase primary sigma factor